MPKVLDASFGLESVLNDLQCDQLSMCNCINAKKIFISIYVKCMVIRNICWMKGRTILVGNLKTSVTSSLNRKRIYCVNDINHI